jgi:hypothetical protein
MGKNVKGMAEKQTRALDNKQKHQLNKWLENNYEKIKTLARHEIALLASNEIGFEVSISSVSTGIDATGLLMKPSRKIKPETGLTRQGLALRRHKVLLTFLKELSESLDIEYPKALNNWLEAI